MRPPDYAKRVNYYAQDRPTIIVSMVIQLCIHSQVRIEAIMGSQ